MALRILLVGILLLGLAGSAASPGSPAAGAAAPEAAAPPPPARAIILVAARPLRAGALLKPEDIDRPRTQHGRRPAEAPAATPARPGPSSSAP